MSPPQPRPAAGAGPDEELMRRFLVGEVTDEEREAVEARMFTDAAFFDSLRALEHEMLVLLARDELPARWADPLSAVVETSPARRRRFRDVQDLIGALPSHTLVSPTAPGPARRSPADRWWLRVAAVLLVGAGAAGWWMRSGPEGGGGSGDVPAFALVAGPTRASGETVNTIRLPRGASRVRLVAVLDATASVVEASMRPVGGAPLALPPTTRLRAVDDGLEVVWELPAESLPAGDYLIAYTAGEPSGDAPVIGSRFLRILRTE